MSSPANGETTVLRGLSVSAVLLHCGRIFASSEGSAETYNLSVPVAQLDAFISHSWRTQRWKKFLALCLHFNINLALMASLIIGMLGSLLCSLKVLPAWNVATTDGTSGVTNPTGPWCMLLSWFAFNFVLLFGRNLFPATSRLEPKVFLDKACIHQTDALLKEAGISSLGEFTFFSWSLVVLDSEDYLRRLWTDYELASFVIIRPRGRVVFLPVNFSVFVSVTFAAFLMVGLLLFVVKLLEVNDAVSLGLPSAVLGVVFVLQTTAMSVKSPLWFFVFGDESSCSGIDLRFFLFVGGARANRCHRHSICHAKIPATHSRRSLLVSFGFSPRSSTEKVIVFREAMVSQALNARLRRTVCLSKEDGNVHGECGHVNPEAAPSEVMSMFENMVRCRVPTFLRATVGCAELTFLQTQSSHHGDCWGSGLRCSRLGSRSRSYSV